MAVGAENAGGRQRGKCGQEAEYLPTTVVRGNFPDREPANLLGIDLVGLRHPQNPFRGARKHVVITTQNFRGRQGPGDLSLFVQNLRRYEAGSPFDPIRRSAAPARGRA